MTQPISCLNFESRINQRLDARLLLKDDKELERHATTCEPCRNLMTDYQKLERCLDAFMLANSGYTNLSGARQGAIDMPVGRQRSIISIAAVLLVGMSLAFGSQSDSGPANSVISANRISTIPPTSEVPHGATDDPSNARVQEQPEFRQPVKHSLVNWNQISEQLQPLNSYYQFSAELPGVRPIHFSLSITLNWFQQTFFGPSRLQMSDPGFGGIVIDQNRYTA